MMVSEYPPVISSEEEVELLEVASDYALSIGLVLRPVPVPVAGPGSTSLDSTRAIHAPYSLYPTPFPRRLFQEALALQPIYNELYARITTSHAFLARVIGGTVQRVDEFQRQLYDIYSTVLQEGIKQPISLGIFRSDYLVHAPADSRPQDWTLKQVEFNTISSSFGALSTRVSQLHRYLLETDKYPPGYPLLDPSSSDRLPANQALEGIARGLVDAHRAYPNPKHAKIMMVIQDGERNAFDQRLLEWEVTNKHKVPLVRVPFSQLRTTLSLDPTTCALLYSPRSNSTPIEISVVYYRTAYSPTDYYTSQEWSTRLLVERSLAIKCPSVAMQLAGAKKVQQVLSDRTQLGQFIDEPELLNRIEKSFVGLESMEPNGVGERFAKSHPERYVLKPQREGGGNNIYRTDIPPFLDQLAQRDLERQQQQGEEGQDQVKGQEGYILMELIEPPRDSEQVLVKAGQAVANRDQVVSELGIYGIMLLREQAGEQCHVLKNETVGHLLRTKGRDSDEGGIAVGFSVLDSPLLV
ncbi:glutathione synthase [Sporobolomyces koalae]|uniref:glutathione synthase n=1 Tax=Sporobolomyces koalae TaxID=500713 RepID=UPI0031816F2B